MKKSLKLVSLLTVILSTGLLLKPDFSFGQSSGTGEIQVNEAVKVLTEEIEEKKDYSQQIEKKQKELTEKIEKAQNAQASLANQLAILENRMAKTMLDIEKVQNDIDRTALEIRKTDLEIKDRNVEIESEKNHIGNVLKIMYEKDQITTLEIMLMNDSLSDFLSQVKYLENVNESLDKSLGNLEKLKRQLEKQKENLDEQKISLGTLKENLADQVAILESETDDKIFILSEARQSETEYQKLLAAAKKEQEQANSEIASLEKSMREKLAELEGDNEETQLNYDGMVWPVTKNTITSTFHDPDYPFRHIFEHPAIDVRASQGTTLKAAASGYVARVKDGGKTGYSYIMLVHADGLSTVYGHVSKIYVNADDYVTQGQPIGLSGGMPGTSGAGALSTGPHLHFEVRLDGIPVNPMNYLP